MTSTFNRVATNVNSNNNANVSMEQNTNNSQPEDYLEKQQVALHLKEAISLLLENRPENPIAFLAEHFRNMQMSGAQQLPPQPNGIVASPSNIMKAYRLLAMNRQGAAVLDQKAFSDNVFQAY